MPLACASHIVFNLCHQFLERKFCCLVHQNEDISKEFETLKELKCQGGHHSSSHSGEPHKSVQRGAQRSKNGGESLTKFAWMIWG